MAVSRERDIAELKLNLQRQIEVLDENAPLYAERLAATQELARQKRKEINDKWDLKEQEDRLAKIEFEQAEHQAQLNEQYLNDQITDQQFTDQGAQLLLDSESRKLDIIKEIHGETSVEYQRAFGEYLSLQKDFADEAVKLKEDEEARKRQAAVGTLNVAAGAFGALAAMQKEGSEQAKAFAVAQALMSTFSASISAYDSTVKIPFVGTALAPIAAAAAFAFGMTNVNKIRNQKTEAPTKAEKGMVLSGPSHAQGGIPIEAEGDEIILTKGVYRNPRLRAMASEINYAGGGRKFAMGGPVTPFTGKESSGVNSKANVDIENLLIRLERNTDRKIDSINSSINSRIDTLKVLNVATETQEVNDQIKKIQNAADV